MLTSYSTDAPAPARRVVVYTGIAAALVILIGGSFLGYRSFERVVENERWVAHTDSVILELEAILSDLTAAESAHRGYVITHEQAFLLPVMKAEREVGRKCDALRWLMRDNAGQLQRFDSARVLIDEKMQWMTHGCVLVEAGRHAEAITDIQTGKGRQLMNQVRDRIEAMQGIEHALKKERAEHTSRSFSTMLVTISATAVTGIVLLFVIIAESRRTVAQQVRTTHQLHRQRELLRITLASIGDALISTDKLGKVTYLNAVAESLTRWTTAEATGLPLEKVFHIVNETTRKPVENPAMRALATGVIVGLANHTILIARDGTEVHIDDSAAPIKNEEGEVSGCVLIFRDIGEQRHAEAEAMRLAAIVASSDDAIISKSLQGIIQTWNKGAEKLFGYAAEEAVGQPATLLIPSDRQDEEPDILGRIARGEMIDHYETVRRRKDGSLMDVSLTISPLRDPHGQIIGASKIARDITERKRVQQALRERNALLRTALEAADQGTWALDVATGRFRSDERYKAIFGTSVTGLTEKEAIGNIHPDDQARVQVAVTAALDPDDPAPYSIEYRVVHSDGSVHWVYAKGSAHYTDDGAGKKLTGFAGTVTDITDRRKAEEDLQQIAAELSESDRRKSEFLATLAHELRGPLAPISNMLELLKGADKDPQLVEMARSTMQRQVNQLVLLVDDLLDINRISQGKIELRRSRVELAAVLQQAVEACRPLAEAEEHELIVDPGPNNVFVHGDPVRLAQIFGNLLNNACKYTPKGGRIKVSVATEGDKVLVRFRDNGIGIASDHLDHVFTMFAQVDPHFERAQGGLGIGLSLVKQLLEMHGGSVQAKSEGLGRGSEFIVRLPILVGVVPTVPEQPAGNNAPHTPSQCRILVVDDNLDGAQTLSLLLRKRGHATAMAHDGEEALAQARSFAPEVVLLDVGLPKLNGHEVCRRIRLEEWGRDMLIIAITGWGQEEDRKRTAEAGFDAHLVKPMDLRDLDRIIAARNKPGVTA